MEAMLHRLQNGWRVTICAGSLTQRPPRGGMCIAGEWEAANQLIAAGLAEWKCHEPQYPDELPIKCLKLKEAQP